MKADTLLLMCPYPGVEYTRSSGSRGASASISQVHLKDYGASPDTYTLEIPSGAEYINIFTTTQGNFVGAVLSMIHTETYTDTDSASQVGYVGGGTYGGGYPDYQGTQVRAGENGSFGAGADQSASDYRYCSGAGGGGWYGGGSHFTDTSMYAVEDSGGGSGWVNTYASRNDRPSGYTGLQLDSGTTYDGEQSFPATSGGSETGHSGNGYARITKIS